MSSVLVLQMRLVPVQSSAAFVGVRFSWILKMTTEDAIVPQLRLSRYSSDSS